jgi:hypothetical protein
MAREPVLPTLRAAIFAALCLCLGAAAHRAMSGAAIPAWALVLGGIGAYLPARYAAARGEQGLLGIAALMGGLQVAFHLLFSYAQQVGSASASGTMLGMSMPGMDMPTGTTMPGMPTADAAASEHMTTGMLLGHALAALICAWWLRRGEAALHAVLRSAVFRLREFWVVVVFAMPPVDRISRSARVEPRPRDLRSQWSRGVAVQRGPPRLAVYR